MAGAFDTARSACCSGNAHTSRKECPPPKLRPSERAAHCTQAGAAELRTQASTIERLEAAAAQQELGLRTALENVQEAGEGTAVALLRELVHTLPYQYLYLDVTNMHLQPCRDVTRCPFGMNWPPDML